MNSYDNIGKTLAKMTVLAAVAIGVGLLVAWMMARHDSVAPVTLVDTSVPTPQVIVPVPPVSDPSAAVMAHHNSQFAPPPPASPATIDTRTTQEKLEEILLAGGDANDKADKILALMPAASPDDQVELSRHLINMAQDDHYDGVAQLLTNATTPAAVSTVLMNDLLNRHNTLKLPMLLAVARNDDHPLKGEARDMLELFIQQDYGTNWDQWSDSVDSWLQQNEQ